MFFCMMYISYTVNLSCIIYYSYLLTVLLWNNTSLYGWRWGLQLPRWSSKYVERCKVKFEWWTTKILFKMILDSIYNRISNHLLVLVWWLAPLHGPWRVVPQLWRRSGKTELECMPSCLEYLREGSEFMNRGPWAEVEAEVRNILIAFQEWCHMTQSCIGHESPCECSDSQVKHVYTY